MKINQYLIITVEDSNTLFCSLKLLVGTRNDFFDIYMTI